MSALPPISADNLPDLVAAVNERLRRIKTGAGTTIVKKASSSGGSPPAPATANITKIRVSVGGSPVTISPPSAGVDGSELVYIITQNASPQVIAWLPPSGGVSGFKFAPPIPLTASTVSVVCFYGDSTDGNWYNAGGNILGRHA